jgi:lipoate-protein ligase A
LTASHTGAGGTVSVHVRLDGAARDRIRDVLFTGDFLVTPPRVVLDLEARLRGLPVSQVGQVTERFLAATGVGLLALAPADFRAAIESAIGPTALGPTAIASTAIASTAPTSTI